MSSGVRRLSGEEWQAFADQLLVRRYGPAQYQKIPAKDSGDAGIEGFTLCGHAYQAYGVVEPVTTKARYEKQRDKITTDIGKFIDNKSKLVALLGTLQLNRWCLFVPQFDSKDIVSHAAIKTAEVIAANLSYVANDFRVMVCEEDKFAVERDALINAGIAKFHVTPATASNQAIQEWAEENDNLVKQLDQKISRLSTCGTQAKRRSLRDQLLKHFLEGQNLLEELRKCPAVWEQIDKAKRAQEEFLATECMVATGSAAQILQDALKAIKAAVAKAAVGISDHNTNAMAWEAVADWLLRCPLDFPEEVTSQ